MTHRLMTPHLLPPTDDLAGIVILAGGASSRMGTPKATLRLPNGERLLDYHIRHAQKLSVPIMVADNGRGFLTSDSDSDDNCGNNKSDIVAIADYRPPMNDTFNSVRTEGALVAIIAAMQTLINQKMSQPSMSTNANTNANWLLVISCDSLITAPDIWQHLSFCMIANSRHNSTADNAIVCLSDDAHVYPLLGLYHQRLATDLQAYVDHGQRRVMPFITSHLRAVPINPAWQALTNFNTPAAFAQACTAIVS